MPAAAALVHALDRQGIRLTTDGASLVATPADRLTDDHRALIRAHKPDLIALLQSANDDPGSACRRWRARYPDGREVSLSRTPPATREEIQADHPGAEIRPEPEPPARALSEAALAVAHALLDQWGEDDPLTRAEYLDALARDPERLDQCFRAAVERDRARGENPDETL